MNTFKLLSLVAFASLSIADTGKSAVIVDGGTFSTQFNSAPLASFTSVTVTAADISAQGFSASGDDKLVLLFSTRNDGNNGGLVSAVSYNGIALNSAIQEVTGRVRHSIWYLDNVIADGDVAITVGTSDSYTLRLFALNGTADDVQNTNSANTNGGVSPSLVSTGAGAFFLYNAARNNGGTLGVSDPDYTTNVQNNTEGGRSTAYWSVQASATTEMPAVSGTPNAGFIGAVFEANSVPEPSAIAFLGLGGIALIMRRRK